VALIVKDRDPADIAAELAAQRIGIGNGNFYAYRLMQALDIPPEQGVVRLSFVHYTTNHELTRLMEALNRIL
jgi:selenocysteine lyase/cysteine desulfurase